MSRGPELPTSARLLVRLGARGEDRDLLMADLEERFAVLAAERGAGAARRWYWSQALRGIGVALRPGGGLIQRVTLGGLAGDVRVAVRGLRRRPFYAFGVAGTLAMGLASAAAVLSVTWHVWLAPMPWPDPGGVLRLVELEPVAEASGASERRQMRLSPPLLEDLRAHDWSTVEAIAGISRNVLDWQRADRISRLSAAVVSPEAFVMLGISPVLGRILANDEDLAEVVLAEPFWESAFGADPSVVGQRMQLGSEEHVIVGVVPLPTGYPASADVVTLLRFGPEERTEGMRGARYLDVIARAGAGFGVEDVSLEFERLMTSYGRDHANHAGWSGMALPLAEDLLRPYRQVLALLFCTGLVFLVLAVVNVAGLAAARTVQGRRDRAVRLAIGASERSLLRGSLVESLLLGSIAGIVALVGAAALVGPIRALVPPEVPRVENVGLDGGVGVVIVVLALVCSIGVGWSAYWLARASAPSLTHTSSSASPGSTGQSVLVAGQIALTVLLATTGGGLVRHVVSLRSTDLGFDPDGIVSSQVMLTGPRYPDAATRLGYWRDLLGGLHARGVDAAVGTSPPMAGVNMPWGYRADPTEEQAFAQYHIVSPSYFRIMGIEVVEGRPFNDEDRQGAAPVVVVNEALAERHFPDQVAVGREITVLETRKRIVGVVRSVRHAGPEADAPEEMYAPAEQDPWPHAQILARGEAATLGPVIADVVDALDPSVGVPPVDRYDRFVAQWYAALHLQMIIVGVLAGVGTLLATLGLYALVAYRVTSRRREIGVRMALGASGTRVSSDVVREGAHMAGAGLLVGLLAWYALLPVTASVLGLPRSGDVLVPLGVIMLVVVVSLLASALPARSSVRVDPSVTLRAE